MRSMERFEKIPMLSRVTKNVYKLCVHYPFGMLHVNSYLFQGENGFTVVDTGSNAAQSIGIWEEAIAGGIEIEKVVITHTHPDHLGLAGWLKEKYKIPIWMAKSGYREVERMRKNETGIFMSRLIKEHGGPDIPFDLLASELVNYQFEPDFLFDKDDKLQFGKEEFEVIWTPGHAPDHFCFYQPEKEIMVVGDHVLDDISPIVAVWSESDVNPLKDYFDSLDRVSSRSTSIALPGHGENIFDLPKRAAEIRGGHNHRMEQIMDLFHGEEKTASQLSKEIYGKLSIYKFFAPFMATITRLVHLESIGKVQKCFKNEKYYYTPIN